MADRSIEMEGMTVVITGSFNPAIFHPSWFSENRLIRNEEAKDAKVEIITPDASIFSVKWFFLQAISQRISIHCNDPSKFSPLRDLAVGMFQVLEHTPIAAFGLNRDRHYKPANEDDWRQFVEYLIPSRPLDGLLSDPTLGTIAVTGHRGTDKTSRAQVKIEPSTQVPHGFFVAVHQHYQVAKDDQAPSASEYCRLIAASWTEFLGFSEDVPVQMFQRFDSRGK